MTITKLTEALIYEVLDTVKDPEIDTVSIIDLGMIERVQINDNHVRIEVLPTFSGCPALDNHSTKYRKSDCSIRKCP